MREWYRRGDPVRDSISDYGSREQHIHRMLPGPYAGPADTSSPASDSDSSKDPGAAYPTETDRNLTVSQFVA